MNRVVSSPLTIMQGAMATHRALWIMSWFQRGHAGRQRSIVTRYMPTHGPCPAPKRPLKRGHGTHHGTSLAALALLVLCGFAPPPANESPARAATPLDRLLADWAKQGDRTESVTARFVRSQQTQLMREPMVSKGRFYWTPHAMRWQTIEPEPSEMILKGRLVEMYYPELKLLERHRLREQDMFWTSLPGLSLSIERIRADYDIELEQPSPSKKTDSPDEQRGATADRRVKLRLIPKKEGIAKFIRSITLWTPASRFMPDRIEYVERGGDTVSITLERIEIDAPLDDETFVLDLPEDVEITELLDEIK